MTTSQTVSYVVPDNIHALYVHGQQDGKNGKDGSKAIAVVQVDVDVPEAGTFTVSVDAILQWCAVEGALHVRIGANDATAEKNENGKRIISCIVTDERDASSHTLLRLRAFGAVCVHVHKAVAFNPRFCVITAMDGADIVVGCSVRTETLHTFVTNSGAVHFDDCECLNCVLHLNAKGCITNVRYRGTATECVYGTGKVQSTPVAF